MKILITSDFYYDFELIEADSVASAEKYIYACLNNKDLPQDITVLGSSNDMDIDEVLAQAEKILYLTDYIDD